MPIVAAGIMGGSSILGGILGGNAQDKAAKAAAEAQRQALSFTQGVYGTAKDQYNPYITTGTNALYSLGSLFGLPGAAGQPTGGAQSAFQQFTQTPAYQFPLEQAMLGANRGLAASGLTGSGAQMRELSRLGAGYASQGFGNYIGQLAQLAGLGNQSIGNLGSIGTGASQVGAGLSQGIAGAQAGGILGQNNSLLSGLTGALGAFGSPNVGGQSSTSFGGQGSALAALLGKLGGSGASSWGVPAGGGGAH